ncbi:MAG: ABC transporter permease subunit [Campylobacteraceae bacterium]|nr:ABC transporter permease subunit [Campylobacteraceae bacterium]
MRKFKDFIIIFYAYFSALCVVFVVFTLFYFIISRSNLSIEFLTTNPKGLILGQEGGVKDAIIGSLLLMLLAMLISGILGISCAIYRVVYCKNRFIKTALNFIIRAIGSVPSILIGLFVYGFFIVSLNIPKSLLTASIALAMMVFAFVELSVEKNILEIDKNAIKDSYSLGVDKTYMVLNLLLPLIKNSIISTLILAGSYAIGATAPLLLTGAVFMASPSGLLSPIMALPFHLHMLLNQSVSSTNAYSSALVLMLILVILHIISALISQKIGEKIVKRFIYKKS